MLLLLALVLFIVAASMWRLPVAECPECPHCKQLKREDELKQKRLQAEYRKENHLFYCDHPDHKDLPK